MTALACVANIGSRQRRLRLAFGVAASTASALILAGLLAAGTPVWTRLFTALPFWFGMLGVLQHREKT